MSDSTLSLLLGLVLAHLVGDFLLQPGSWVTERYRLRERSPRLYLHAGIHGTLAAGVLAFAGAFDIGRPAMQVDGVVIAIGGLTVAISHALIDLFKASLNPGKLRWFLFDQALHLLVILGLWLTIIATRQPLMLFLDYLTTPSTLALLVTYLVVTRPMAFAIAMVMRRWSAGLDEPNTLVKAGARIGMLERLLVLTLVLHNQITAVGFLITAKTVLRYGDLREAQDRKLTEYVLLGTLLSVASTVILGLAVRSFL
ncbi:DUF3307 domain-containing protein [Pistricoccus aurantiacus]|uniref:DUF3307 domain-containing protein n=1 Tax=Pistricoccus aurantiacus TaxID=1883414 RepID=A0A5B8SZ72_9GAMM|nr:DUF3307 domain-containing protein [Pistricoccus aurantiacus]QEA40098.1 DUF3307 domain-containing protein [Pistricoccus aurantiacus]